MAERTCKTKTARVRKIKHQGEIVKKGGKVPMHYETLIVEEDKQILTITLNRPEMLNAFNEQMIIDLGQALDQFQTDEKLKVLVITGKGKLFSAGGDVRTMEQVSNAEEALITLKKISDLTEKIWRLPKPVIAAVNGPAMGVAMNYVLACDLAYASERAQFSQAYMNVGLITDGGGTYLLQKTLSLCQAKELLYTGKVISAQEAYRLGLINAVVKHDDLLPTVYGVAEELLNRPLEIIAIEKQLLRQNANESMEACIYNENVNQAICMQKKVHKDLVQAFLNKMKINKREAE